VFGVSPGRPSGFVGWILEYENNTVVYQGAIDDRPSPKGDPRKARNYVREAITRLLAGEKIEVAETRSYGCGVKYPN